MIGLAPYATRLGKVSRESRVRPDDGEELEAARACSYKVPLRFLLLPFLFESILELCFPCRPQHTYMYSERFSQISYHGSYTCLYDTYLSWLTSRVMPDDAETASPVAPLMLAFGSCGVMSFGFGLGALQPLPLVPEFSPSPLPPTILAI